MEYKKKKNDVDRSDRKIFIGLGITCLFGLFMLFLFFQTYFMCACSPPPDSTFEQTATSIVATNNAVATLIQQTNIAATEQFMLTGTALP